MERSRNGHRCVPFGQLSFDRIISNNVIAAIDCIVIKYFSGTERERERERKREYVYMKFYDNT